MTATPGRDVPVLRAAVALDLLVAAARAQADAGRLTVLPPTAGDGAESCCERQVRLLLELHQANGQLWMHEDEIRAPGRTGTEVAVLRRAIEGLNMARNDRVDRLNETYAQALRPLALAPLATEAPGSALDRLSVLALRLAHTGRRARVEDSLLGRLPLLRTQLADLREAIDLLLDDVRAGRRRFATYQAGKLYGPHQRPGKE